jgi:hypothetical protein
MSFQIVDLYVMHGYGTRSCCRLFLNKDQRDRIFKIRNPSSFIYQNVLNVQTKDLDSDFCPFLCPKLCSTLIGSLKLRASRHAEVCLLTGLSRMERHRKVRISLTKIFCEGLFDTHISDLSFVACIQLRH